MRFSRWIERILLAVGIVCCTAFVLRVSYGYVRNHLARVAIEATAQNNSDRDAPSSPELPIESIPDLSPKESKPDFTLWGETRIKAYEVALARHFDPPLALLEIPKLRLSVAVFDGTDDLTLDRGAGRVIGTARVGGNGNLAIAGHRDGFFRALKDIKTGDEVKLVTGTQTILYSVDQITIVKPTNVEVLANQATPTLTLITCYPFYFTGSAPERYIVQCSLKRSVGEHTVARREQPAADAVAR